MPFTPIGGLGDITTLVGLISTTCQLIAECYRASEEQQAVLASLKTFESSLLLWKPIIDALMVQKGWQNHPTFDAARIIILQAIGDCNQAIDNFCKKLVAVAVVSGNSPLREKFFLAVKKAKQRVHWALFLKREAKELQGLLHERTMLVMNAATGINMRL